MRSESKRTKGQTSGPVLTTGLMAVLDHCAMCIHSFFDDQNAKRKREGKKEKETSLDIHRAISSLFICKGTKNDLAKATMRPLIWY